MYLVYKKDTRNQSLETSFPATLNEAKNPVLVIARNAPLDSHSESWKYSWGEAIHVPVIEDSESSSE